MLNLKERGVYIYCKKVCKLVFYCGLVFGSLGYITSSFADEALEDTDQKKIAENAQVDSDESLTNQEDDVNYDTCPNNGFYFDDQELKDVLESEEAKSIIKSIKDNIAKLGPYWCNTIFNKEFFANFLKEVKNNIPHPESLGWDALMDAIVSTFFDQNRLNNLNNQNPVRTAITRDIGRLITLLPKWYTGSRYDLSGRPYDLSDILSQGIKVNIKLIGYILCNNALCLDLTNSIADAVSQSIVETGKAWRQNNPNSAFIPYLLNNFSFADSATSALSKNVVANGVGTFLGTYGVVMFINGVARTVVKPLVYCFPNNPLVAGIPQGAILSASKTAILSTVTRTAITYMVEGSRGTFFTTLSGLGTAVYIMYIRQYDPNGFGLPVLIIVVARDLYNYFTASNDDTVSNSDTVSNDDTDEKK